MRIYVGLIIAVIKNFVNNFLFFIYQWVLSIVMRKIFQKNFLSVTCELLLECI